jgi:ascorbate-specific PTS system EIIC-type component UlaA
MDWLKKLPNTRRSPSGLEWKLWRKLPLIFAVGTLVPVLVALALHLLTDQTSATDARWLQTMDYVVAGVVLFHWTAVLTVAIGCVVVMLMKGPGYVADPLELSHSDKPRKQAERQEP